MPKMKEIGRVGQKRYSGVFEEEFLPELRGPKGVETYKELAENDDVIGALLFAIEMLIRQATWDVEPGGETAQDKEASEFVRSCMDDMQDTWTDTLSEILSFLTYGWSYHEIVYKRRMGKTRDERTRSKYSDGLIGWAKLPIRAQETLYQWEYDDQDNLLGMTQLPPPDYRLCTIPIEKALLFRTKSRKGNPEGKSILRNCYRDYYFKRRIQEYEGIGVERDLAGIPVIIAPEHTDIWSDTPDARATLGSLEDMVRKIRVDEMAGVVLPYGYEFKLLSSSGTKQFDTNEIINRYDTRMAMTVLADFIFLGQQSVGSFALSSDKTELFATAIGAYLDIICEVFNNQAIPRLIQLNGEHFSKITDYPRMVHGDIEQVDISKISTYIKDLSGIGAIIPDEPLEDYLREAAGLPQRDPGTAYEMPQKDVPKNPDEQDQTEDKKVLPETTDDIENDIEGG